MKLDPSIIALKDFVKSSYMFRLKLASYSTALLAPSINTSESGHSQCRQLPIYNTTPDVHNINATVIALDAQKGL